MSWLTCGKKKLKRTSLWWLVGCLIKCMSLQMKKLLGECKLSWNLSWSWKEQVLGSKGALRLELALYCHWVDKTTQDSVWRRVPFGHWSNMPCDQFTRVSWRHHAGEHQDCCWREFFLHSTAIWNFESWFETWWRSWLPYSLKQGLLCWNFQQESH